MQEDHKKVSVSKSVSKKINEIGVKKTILLVNTLEKTDLVSKNVSKRGKEVNISWSLMILTC